MWSRLCVCLVLAVSWLGVESSLPRAAALKGRALLGSQVPVGGDVHPWDKLLGLSFHFYEAQQSGHLPSWNRARKGAPGGWRNNSHCEDGHGPDAPGVDLSGGFYEAGNHLKCQLQFSHAFSTLATSMLLDEAAYRATGEWDNAMRNMKWAAQWLVKAHLVSHPNPKINKLVAQVGDPTTDHTQWGRPEQMQQMGVQGTTGWRPVQTTLDSTSGAATDILGTTAGAMATLSMLLRKPSKSQDVKLADDLLSRARNLLAAGSAGKQGVWMPKWGTFQYPSQSWQDDLAWGAAALCWADLSCNTSKTALPASCSDAFTKWQAAYQVAGWQLMWDWNSQLTPAALALIALQPQLTAASANCVPQAVVDAHAFMDRLLSNWMDRTKACPMGDFQVCYTAGGLAYFTQWAPLRYAGLTSCAATSAALYEADPVKRRNYRCWARSQMRYAAGDNPAKQSYIVGYQPSSKYKKADRVHHRSSSCDPNYNKSCTKTQLYAATPNPSVLQGALVGGPSNMDCYNSTRDNYVQTEVALDYNGGFTCAMAALARATRSLQANRCSWDTYCAGGCDAAADK